MKALILIILLGFAFFIALLIALRLLKSVRPSPCPWQVSWVLENPARRLVASPTRTLDWVGLRKGMHALEMGPGPGYLTPEAAKRLGAEGSLYCLDIQPQMLAKIKKKLPYNLTKNIALVTGDATSLPFQDKSLDLAFLVFVLGEIPHREQALAELHRVLKPGGTLSISEVLIDPDYSRKSTVIAEGSRAGFQPFQEHGNFVFYTVNFRREGN